MTTTVTVAVLLLWWSLLVFPARGQWENAEVRTYTLRHVPPVEIQRMLNDLVGADKNSKISIDQDRQQVLVSGPESVHKLTRQLIEQVDRPVSKPVASPVIRTYAVPDRDIAASLTLIRKIAGKDARVTANASNSHLIVAAGPATHDRIANALSGQSATAQKEDRGLFDWSDDTKSPQINVADPDELFPRGTGRPVSGERGTRQFRLESITTKQCQQALSKLLGRRLKRRDADQLEYTANGATINLVFDAERQACTMSGDREMIQQFEQLLTGFEQSRNRAADETMRFLPVRNVRPEVLNRALRIWKATSAAAAQEGARTERSSPIQTVGFFQDEEPPKADAEDEPLRRPSPDVDVSPLPDLDVLILRGRDPDVKELIRIIEEIERISDEIAPEIEVYQLQHVKGSALQSVIADVIEELAGPLQGRIAITPLSRPNALLLIGYGEAVLRAKELIQKLDQPTESQMKIFNLKHAPASEAATTISGFLNGRGNLSPDVNITPNSRTNSLIVYAAPSDMEEVARLVERLDVDSAESVNQAKMVRLKHALASDVSTTISNAITAARSGASGGRSAALEMLLVQPNGRKVVASGLLDSVTLTPDTRTNSIFITGPAASLPLVEQLINELDRSPTANAQIKVFQVSNGDASDLVIVLRSLFPEAASSSTVPQLATAEGETSLVPVRFSVDVRTNTIIATGTSGDLQIIDALLLRLDSAESQQRVNRVYRLKNSPATDVARAVNEFLRSERIVNQAAPGRQNPFQQIEQEVVVVPEPVRNSLIISATPRYFQQILELVEDLDDQPPQVMIQVVLAEVDLENFNEFGVELGLQDSLLFDRSILGNLITTTTSVATSTPAGVVTTTTDNIVSANNTPGFDFNNNPLGNSGSTQALNTSGTVAGQALSHFSLGRVNSDLEYGGLVLSASSENVSVVLRALDQSGSMEVLSRPQIMTLDNQQAFIQVGQRVPRIVSSQLTQLGQINSLALEDVGLLLGVTPRISPDGHVVMEVDAEKSAVGPEREGIPISVSSDGAIIRSPRVDVTTAQTTVSAASGQTIVIGGLITNSNQTLSRRVPWLGDLPVVGNLFRYDGNSHARKELLIILTPHVILGDNEAEHMKQVEMSRMSWISADVFQWINSPPPPGQTADDDDIPVIYPDAPQPSGNGATLTPIPKENIVLPPDTPVIKESSARNEKTGSVTQASWAEPPRRKSRFRFLSWWRDE